MPAGTWPAGAWPAALSPFTLISAAPAAQEGSFAGQVAAIARMATPVYAEDAPNRVERMASRT